MTKERVASMAEILRPGAEGGFNGKKERYTRRELVDQWRNAPEKVDEYKGGTGIDVEDNIYQYEPGHRLLIGDKAKGIEKQVMDTCETPWAFATVDKAFAEFSQESGPLKVLERGFGMGITSRRAIQNLITRGGEYTVIELNKGNAKYAREWIKKQKDGLTDMAGGLPGTKPIINISIIEGDAHEETANLAKEGRKFDIIISDTFPLNEEEQGINDLQDLDTLKHCLKPGGVFTFFAFYPGSNSGTKELQISMVRRHFSDYRESDVGVNPPPDYVYLQTEKGSIRKLPVVICKKPII